MVPFEYAGKYILLIKYLRIFSVYECTVLTLKGVCKTVYQQPLACKPKHVNFNLEFYEISLQRS